MPIAKCLKCGGLTNSTTSNYWFTKNNKPTECYAKNVSGKWVKGCTEPPEHEKDWIDSLISPRPQAEETMKEKGEKK